jgi:hypothetical protein
MAQIHEEVVVVKISKLAKVSDKPKSIISKDLVEALQELSEQLVEPGCIVEIETAKQS